MNVYRNRLTDSHLDDLLGVAYSNSNPDIYEMVKKKKMSQYQKSHRFKINI